MEMTKKQVLGAAAAAVAVALIFVWLFALPVNAKISEVVVSRISNEAFKDTVVPYYLDKFSQEYIEDVDHFIDDYTPEALASDYREIYVVIDMSKFTPVKFRQLWVDVENIPEKYADTVVCVTNGPLMTQPETSDMKANITLIVKQNDFTNEQLEQMAKELSYRVKWGLAMGVDGYVHI